MHRYKLAVHILVILSVFNFVPVLAAPVAVRVHEACADMADGGDDVVIVLGKRAVEGQDPLTQASPDPQRLPSTSDYASGVHQETTNPIQPPTSGSGEMERPPYASGGTEPHLLTPGQGGVQQVQPGTTSKLLPSSSAETKPYPWRPNTEIGPATPSESSGEIGPATPPESSGKITPTQPPWEVTEKPRPPPKTVLNKLTSKTKSFFRNSAKIFKGLLKEMVDHPHQL